MGQVEVTFECTGTVFEGGQSSKEVQRRLQAGAAARSKEEGIM